MTADHRCSRQLRDQWRRVVLVVVPVLLTPIFMYLSPELRCAFEMCLLNCYLLLNEIPTAISALLPVCLAPLLGPLSTQEVCAIYFGPSQLYFISATVIAVAAAESTLSQRLALHVLARLGPGTGRLVCGTVVGSVLLCFVFNSLVTALLLVALVDSICDELCLVLLDPVIKALPDGRSETTPDMARTMRTESNTGKSGPDGLVPRDPSVLTQVRLGAFAFAICANGAQADSDSPNTGSPAQHIAFICQRKEWSSLWYAAR
ncbi:Na(+)/dicarboxylate cotransporter 3-like [Amblyomma americanum]